MRHSTHAALATLLLFAGCSSTQPVRSADATESSEPARNLVGRWEATTASVARRRSEVWRTGFISARTDRYKQQGYDDAEAQRRAESDFVEHTDTSSTEGDPGPTIVLRADRSFFAYTESLHAAGSWSYAPPGRITLTAADDGAQATFNLDNNVLAEGSGDLRLPYGTLLANYVYERARPEP